MDNYDIENYVRYRKDLKQSKSRVSKLRPTRDEIIIQYMPLVENIAKSFSLNHSATGIMSLNDIIQEGNLGLIAAVDKIDWEQIELSEDPERSIMSFLSKRIRGAIRRNIDKNRSDIRVPEYKINEIRKNQSDEHQVTMLLFNTIFKSISDYNIDIIPFEDDFDIEKLSAVFMEMVKKNLTETEFKIIDMSYGINRKKLTAQEIAEELGIEVNTASVRVSQMKRKTLDKLRENIKLETLLNLM